MNRRAFLGVSAWVGGAALLGLAPGPWRAVTRVGGRLRGSRKLAHLARHLGTWAYADPAGLARVNALLQKDAEDSCRRRYQGYDFPTYRGYDPPGVGRWFRVEEVHAVRLDRSSLGDCCYSPPDDREWCRVLLVASGYYHSDAPRLHPAERAEVGDALGWGASA